jgi:NAD(P)-dependent dehydrogenase (short-subunit alcohol dehydrogenase family)
VETPAGAPAGEEAGSPAALVTGAARGIGRAIALELAAAGFDLVVNYLRSEEAARAVAALVEARGRRARLARADVATREGRERILAAARDAFGRLDLLVNNAAVAPRERRDILETTEESFDEVLAANLKGAYFLTLAAARWMVEIRRRHPQRPLAIVNISSVSEYAASTGRGEYCVAKAGLGMVTRLFAARLAEHGIRVNEVRPGIVATDMTRPVEAEYAARIAAGLTPIRRWGAPEDVARAVRLLAGGDLRFTTGAALDVDGGFHLRVL